MHAVRFSRFGDPSVLELAELPDPHVGRGEVRIRVGAAGVNASDWAKRRGLMDEGLPQTLGYEAAGVVDEVGDGVTDTAVGSRVYGLSSHGAAQAGLAVLTSWAPVPTGMELVDAAAIPVAAETAARALDQLGVARGSALLVNGASGNVGSAATQLAVARGARVLGTGGPASLERLAALGAVPIEYGEGMLERVRAAAPDGLDLALDVAGNGILPELIALTGDRDRVLTVADARGAAEHGVRFSRGDGGRALSALAEVARCDEAGGFRIPVGAVFPLGEVAEAHRAGESGSVRGKIVLVPGDADR